jgi:hypothetical protein
MILRIVCSSSDINVIIQNLVILKEGQLAEVASRAYVWIK